jgi:hypothetical protein
MRHFDRVTGRELTTEEARRELADWLQERCGIGATIYMPWLARIPETPRARTRRKKRRLTAFFRELIDDDAIEAER